MLHQFLQDSVRRATPFHQINQPFQWLKKGGNGVNLSFTPLSYQANDSRPNGLYPLGNGLYQVVADGVAITITPAVQNLAQLTSLLPAGTQVTINNYGVMSAKINGLTYVVQPDVIVRLSGNPTGTASLATGSDGTLRFVDADGNMQTLWPAFLEPDFLLRTLQSQDAAATSSIQLDGTVAIRFQGGNWILIPDLTLGGVPSGRGADFWWQDGANRYRVRTLANWFDGLFQGFGVRQ